MDEQIRRTILNALAQHEGDDLARARAAFRGQSASQMLEPWGHSGKTKAEILAGYEAHVEACERARNWVKAAR